jgi:hypothetical protein
MQKKSTVAGGRTAGPQTGFGKGRILFWISVAVAIHVVFIGPATAPKPAAPAAVNGATPGAAPSTPAPAPRVTTPAGEAKALERQKDNPEVKKITEAAQPGELPAEPGNVDMPLK